MRKLAVFALLLALPACGGGGNKVTMPVVTLPPTPAAAITTTGSGSLVLHPSINPAYAIAMETPIRITETAGGSADWGFARMSLFLNGKEVERAELSATDIRAAGFGRIAANSNGVYKVIFRFNSDDFDRIDMTLGFSDAKDGRQFTTTVAGTTFTDVTISLTPLSLPHSQEPL
jgi:hypothetical protein